MSRYFPIPFVCLSALLLFAALTVKKPGLPMQVVGEEPTWILMTQSLAEDGDLRFEQRDLDRLFADFPFAYHPSVHLRHDATWQDVRFDRPMLYPFLAVPFVKLFGINGMIGFNVLLLLLAIAFAAWNLSSSQRENSLTWIFTCGFFLVSLAWVYAFRFRPEILALTSTTLLFAGLLGDSASAGWRRWLGPFLAGLAILPLIDLQPVWLWLTLPLIGLTAWRRRWWALGAWTIGAVLAIAVALLIAQPLEPSWQQANVSFENPVDWPLPPNESETEQATIWREGSVLKRAELFLIGRHGGLLPYFPFVLIVLLLFALGRDRLDGGLILLGIALTCWALPPLDSASFASEATGNPALLPIYSAFFFLLRPGSLAPGPFDGTQRVLIALGYALATLVLGAQLWTPFGSVTPNASSQAHVRGWPFSSLPTEAHLLPVLPGYTQRDLREGTLWKRDDQVMSAGNDLWLLGGETVEIWFASLEPLSTLVLDLRNLAPRQALDLRFGEHHQRLEFAEVPIRGEQQRLEIPLGAPDRLIGSEKGTVRLHRLELRSERGMSPSFLEAGRRHFYAGAILTWLGTPEGLARDLYAAEWLGCGAPEQVKVGEEFQALVRIRNASSHAWPATGAARVRLSYHWLDANGEMKVRDGLRTELEEDLMAGETVTLWQNIEAPAEAGRFILEFEPLYERVAWFAERNPNATCRAEVEVKVEVEVVR